MLLARPLKGIALGLTTAALLTGVAPRTRAGPGDSCPPQLDDASDVNFLVNGQQAEVSPVKIGRGRILVPPQPDFFQRIGTSVAIEKGQTVKLHRNNITISLDVCSPKATINGKVADQLDVPAKTDNGRTLVPLRFVSKNFGLGISWVIFTTTTAGTVTRIVNIGTPQAESGGSFPPPGTIAPALIWWLKFLAAFAAFGIGAFSASNGVRILTMQELKTLQQQVTTLRQRLAPGPAAGQVPSLDDVTKFIDAVTKLITAKFGPGTFLCLFGLASGVGGYLLVKTI